jgi:hypothetical protein
VPRELNVLALLKGDERYVYVYDEESRQPLLDCFRAQAANQDLSFNWFDAAIMTQKAQEQSGAPAASPDAPPDPGRPARF